MTYSEVPDMPIPIDDITSVEISSKLVNEKSIEKLMHRCDTTTQEGRNALYKGIQGVRIIRLLGVPIHRKSNLQVEELIIIHK